MASKRLKRLRKKAKELGRSVISVGAKVSRVARPLVSFAAGVLYGPAASTAVTAVSHYAHQKQEQVLARNRGMHGRDARVEGRTRAQRTTVHSLAAGGGGALTAAAVGGLGAGAAGLLGQSQLGLGSGAGLIPGLSNPLMASPAAPIVGPGALSGAQVGANLGAQAGAPLKAGALAGAQLGAGAGVGVATPSALASTPWWETASKIAGGASAAKELYDKYAAKLPTDIPGLGDITDKIPGFPGAGGEGGEGGGGGGAADQVGGEGMSDAAKLLLVAAGAYVLSKAA